VSCRKTTGGLRTLWSIRNHGLALTRQAVRVLQDLSRLGRWALSLRCRLALLLSTRLVRLRPLSLQNGGLLGRLRSNRLIGELSSDLLLWLSRGHLLKGLLLLLLRPLQNLGRKLSRHTGVLGLTMGKVLLLLWELLLLRISWKAWRRLLGGRGAYGLSAHHSLNLFHAHGLSRGRGLLRSGGGLRRGLPLRSGLLRLETPDIGAGFQLRDVLGIFVALIASAVRLGRLWDWRPLLVLLGLLLLVLLLLLLGILLTRLV
jgi:hypothetical protein